MNLSGFTAKKMSKILTVAFVLYISASVLIIVIPQMPIGKRITQIYKRYISPGPFFTASRIKETNLFYISWKSNGIWTQPINPPYTHYQNFFSSWNPTLMYKSRLERTIYEKIIIDNNKQADSLSKRNKPFYWTSSYFQNRYASEEADSMRIILIRKVTEQYKTRMDTIQTVTF
jgi:hypothetical protein